MDFIGGQIDQMKAEKEQLITKTNEDKNVFIKKLVDGEDIKSQLSENSSYYIDALKQMDLDCVDAPLQGKDDDNSEKGFFSRLLDLL